MVMSSPQSSDAQQKLRSACQTGDVKALQKALAPQTTTWRHTVWNWLRGVDPDAASLPATLDYVYEDDLCNLPVHYIACGAPASRLQHLLFGCFPVSRHSLPVSNHDQSRAALVQWLSFRDLGINVSVVNAMLETAIHCATRSNSPLTLQALLVTAAGTGFLTKGCLSQRNVQEQQALDLAIHERQWYAVQLLVTAGALNKSPALESARVQLQEAMPMQSSSAQSSLSSLVSGVGRLFSALLAPTSSSDVQASTLAATLQRVQDALEVEAAVPYSSYKDDKEACNPKPLIFLPDLNAVLQYRGDAVQRVITECSVHESTAIMLLNAHQGNADAACRALFLEPIGALEGCGIAPDVAQLVAGADQATSLEHMMQCMVCFEDVQPGQLSVQLPCSHCTCDTCWQGMLRAALEEGHIHQAACPHPNCRLPLAPGHTTALLDRQAASRFQHLLAQQHVNTNPLIRW
ncbi:TPA: hypothetical protein ACH3X2_000769 [Trebouxia sp. C0005]